MWPRLPITSQGMRRASHVRSSPVVYSKTRWSGGLELQRVGRSISLASRQVGTHQLAIETSSRGDLRDINVLISRVRPTARARSALDSVPLAKEDPVRARGTAEVFRIRSDSRSSRQQAGAGRRLAGNQAARGYDHVRLQRRTQLLGELLMSPIRGAPDVQNGSCDRRGDVPAYAC